MLVKIYIHLLINIEMITININNEFIASLHCTALTTEKVHKLLFV